MSATVVPGTVLVHPDEAASDPKACRIMARATTLPGEWPWFRFTGDTGKVPSRGSDLSGWQQQSLADAGRVLGA